METSYTHAVILDFEATCDDRKKPQPQEIIEFPSVLVSLESLKNVSEFAAFVRPIHHPLLSEFCKEFTSIQQSNVDGASSFPEVFTRHQEWLTSHGLTANNAIAVTCGDWDLGTMLPAQCAVAFPSVEEIPEIYTRWHNVKRSFCAVQDRPKAPGMKGMLRELGLPLAGHHHRGIDDCRNIAELCKVLVRKGALIQATAELSISKFPPIHISLRLGNRLENANLPVRTVAALHGVASKTFKCRLAEFHRQDGRVIARDEDLLFLRAGEEIRAS